VDSMALARHLARSDEEMLIVRRVELAMVAGMPAYEAAQHLSRSGLQSVPGYVNVAVRALRIDDDPSYRGLGEDDRDHVLRSLATKGEDLSGEVSELVKRAQERLPDIRFAWAVADLLSLTGCHDAAVQVATLVHDSIPPTRERRHQKRYARMLSLGYEAERAISESDLVAARDLLDQWRQLREDAHADKS